MRYVVIGTSGAGKSTLARALASRTGSPCIELDELHWAPDWVERPDVEFAAAVRAALTGQPRWVVDGNYSVVRDIVWPRATHVVWLNFGRHVVFPRVLWRTLRRTLGRERLWHGNRESLRRAFFSRQSIVLWSLSTFRGNQDKYRRLRAGGAYPHLAWHELRTPAQAAAFIDEQGIAQR
jgi:adenylate kinase family enzyme